MYFIILLIALSLVSTQEANKTNGNLKCMAMLCAPNMECTECATSCPPTCKDPNPKSCEVKVCNAGCVCVKGYVLNEDNKCIPKTECSLVSTSRAFSIFERIPQFDDNGITSGGTNVINEPNNQNSTKCGEDEIYYGCGSCIGTCENPVKVCANSCFYPGNCDCKAYLVRDTKTQKCINKDEDSCAAQRN